MILSRVSHALPSILCTTALFCGRQGLVNLFYRCSYKEQMPFSALQGALFASFFHSRTIEDLTDLTKTEAPFAKRINYLSTVRYVVIIALPIILSMSVSKLTGDALGWRSAFKKGMFNYIFAFLSLKMLGIVRTTLRS